MEKEITLSGGRTATLYFDDFGLVKEAKVIKPDGKEKTYLYAWARTEDQAKEELEIAVF